jgi:hypothetical protein
MMKLKEDLILRRVGGDYVIVDPGQDMVDMSKVFTLNETAAWLWDELKGREFTKDTVVELLCSQYEVTAEQAQEDVKTLLDTFAMNGMLDESGND